MLSWFTQPPVLAGVAFLFGCALGLTRLHRIWSAAIPFLVFTAAVIYTEYFTPYTGGGASMWPIAVLFGGSLVGGSSFAGCMSVAYLRRR